MSRDDENPPSGRKPPSPPAPRTLLGQRISSRPPPPPEELRDSAPYTELLNQLAAAEVEEFADPEMQIRGKPAIARVSWRAKRAAGNAFERGSAAAVEAFGKLAGRILQAARARAEAWRERLGGGIPALRSWLWAKRRELAVVTMSVLGLLLAADLARVHAPDALRTLAAESHIVVDGLVGSGAALRAFAERLGLAEPRPGPPGKVPRPPPPRNRRFLLVTSTPSDATVTVAGTRFKTPIEIPIASPDEPLEVRVQKWGYAVATRTVEPGAFQVRDRAWRYTLDVLLERPVPRAPDDAKAAVEAAPEAAAPTLPPNRVALGDRAPAGDAPPSALPPDREALQDRPASATQPLDDRTPGAKPAETVPDAPF